MLVRTVVLALPPPSGRAGQMEPLGACTEKHCTIMEPSTKILLWSCPKQSSIVVQTLRSGRFQLSEPELRQLMAGLVDEMDEEGDVQ